MPNTTRDDLIEVLEAVSKAQLHALRRLRRGVRAASAPGAAAPPKRMSHIDIVYDILRDARHPLHVSEILARVAQRHGRTLDRESVVSALAKRVARQDRFLRTAPNTFTVLPDSER